VVVCHHGMRSYQVAMYLERAGFPRVYNLQGGIDAWAREIDPAMPRY
jgi:rhodanese-related sulfurtransferase